MLFFKSNYWEKLRVGVKPLWYRHSPLKLGNLKKIAGGRTRTHDFSAVRDHPDHPAIITGMKVIRRNLVPGDPVFMPHSLGREEFILSDVGKIFVGSRNLVQSRPWVFGQNRDSVLPSVVHILDTVGKLKPSHRGDPVKVAREVARIVSLSTFQ